MVDFVRKFVEEAKKIVCIGAAEHAVTKHYRPKRLKNYTGDSKSRTVYASSSSSITEPYLKGGKNQDESSTRDHYFTHDGLKLHYWEWGDPKEETFVFVHGVRDQGRSWDDFIAAMIARGLPIKHAVAIDLRGHGESEWPSTSRGYQHEDFLTDLAGLLRHLDKEPLTIIGHSLGGSMCLLYAGTFPEKVKRMVLLESLGPFARADEEVPEIFAERLKGRDYVEIPFPHESLEAAAKALQKTYPLIPDNAALHMARYGTSLKGGRYRWKYDPILRYRTTTALSEGQIEAFIRRVQVSDLLCLWHRERIYEVRARSTREAFPQR